MNTAVLPDPGVTPYQRTWTRKRLALDEMGMTLLALLMAFAVAVRTSGYNSDSCN